MQKSIGILGGTFDPIHYGHLRLAQEIKQQLFCNEIRFIPCQKPVLDKTAYATAAQRLAMLQLAIQDQSDFVADDRELKRDTPSYMVDTLLSLREEFPTQALCLILGYDAFANLLRWHRWEELIKLSHLLVVNRPGYTLTLEPTLKKFWQQHETQDRKLLLNQTHGYLFELRLPTLQISSTYIRQQFTQKLSPRYLLPDSVLHYIEQEKIYDTSAT